MLTAPTPLTAPIPPLAVSAGQEVFFVLDSNLVVILALELALGLDPSTCCSPSWRGAMAPWVGRLVLRTLFLASQVLCAQMLLSGEGDTLIALQGLTGAVGMVAFTYFLPYVFHAILSTEPLSRTRKQWAVLNVLIGLVLMLTGVASSTAELLGSSTGLFAGTCKLSWTFAPQSPLDPCNASGIPS